ncbi:hypothetical protein BTO30_14945 [Domibacillus antri]|uniref:Uncharacterized protein n=2 Tax=Domibacillus antri TaxID=1714264 RepID=A0A1Q8Q2A7_9BACI|nr:hypothetical protein BTO30_14945 [Domibacillus antri]
MDPVVSVRPHRTGKPIKNFITEEDLEKVLIEGDDNYNNSLVIDFNGNLHLKRFNDAKHGPYAVRFETFVAGNGYVGSASSLSHTENTYLSLLDGWLSHLKGHDKVYRDYPSSKSKEQLLQEIQIALNDL